MLFIKDNHCKKNFFAQLVHILGITFLCTALLAGLIPPPLVTHVAPRPLDSLADILPEPSIAYAAGNVTGTVFRDYDNSGARTAATKPGIAGITVTAYDTSGTASGNATTAGDGSYSITTTGTGPYRIEFTNLPSYLAPSVHGPDSGTTVQFVPDGNSAAVDLALHNPAEYCQADPYYGVSCYTNGDPMHASNQSGPTLAHSGCWRE